MKIGKLEISLKKKADVTEEKKTELRVVIGVYSGIIEDCEIFTDKEEANKYEKQLCKNYEIPYSMRKRKKYYESNGEHEIKHLITKLH